MKYIIVLLFTLGVTTTQAESIAKMPNESNGFIVLTNETCTIGKKTYENLRRAYTYSQQGDTQDGCYGIEDETVVVVWESGNKRRYPTSSFTLINRGKNI